MTKTGLQGPYPLSFDAIDAAVRSKSAGVYALGHADAQGRFCHQSRRPIGQRPARRLLDYIGSERLFKYGYSASSQTAFEKECQLFHDFSPPGNRLHPGPSQGHYVELSSLPDVCSSGMSSAMTSSSAAW